MAIAGIRLAPFLGLAAAAVLAGGLAGCAINPESVVTPGRFDIYTCQDISRSVGPLRLREKELQQLMQQAELSPGGVIASTIAYRSELLQVRGELAGLADSANKKNCASQSPWQSERSIQ